MPDPNKELLDDLRKTFSAKGSEALLGATLAHFKAEGGTVHRLGEDGHLHLEVNLPALPPALLEKIRIIPVGKGMAGLAVERGVPVQSCNIQTDQSGDVKPGAKQTGLQGSTCVPILSGDRPVGALGIGTREERTFTDEENALLLEIGRILCA